MIFHDSQGTNHGKNVQKSTFTLAPCSILMIPYLFYNLLSYFIIFPSLFLFKISSSLLYLTFKGHKISLSRRAALLSFQYTVKLNLKCPYRQNFYFLI